MDITKRFDRILQLFFMLQSKAVVTIEELENRFGTSRRTIYRDLQALEQAGVPVIYELGLGYSIMEGYRIQPSRFTQEEVLSLTIAEKIMQQHETEFVKHHFEAALIKVKGSFQLPQKNVLTDLNDKLHVDASMGTEYLPNVIDVLLSSTVKKLQVKITYLKSSETKAVIRGIEPVGLFYESSCWYVLAYCHRRKDYRNFRLDRIKEILLTEEAFTKEHLPLSVLRKHAAQGEITKISIKVDRKLAHYMFWERQSFGFRAEEVTDDEVVMHFDCAVHPTSFVRWFMKFIDIGEITAPDELRTELAAILTAGALRAGRI